MRPGMGAVNDLLVSFIEEHKSLLCEDVKMPFVDDYVLIVAMRDLDEDGHGGLAYVHTRGITTYRLRGLLETAVDYVVQSDDEADYGMDD